MALLALCVGLVQGSIYSQYTLDGPEVTDTFGRTSTTKKLALGSGSNAVCGKSYHMRSGDFISLKEGNGAPTGNVDFSIAGYVKPVVLSKERTLFTLGGTDRASDRSRDNWGAWVMVDSSGGLSVRTPLIRVRSSGKVVVGVWHQVVLTYTAAETMLRLWVDDKLVLSESATMDLQQSSRYGGMAIGEYHLGGSKKSRFGEFFVDQVSFADHVMTPQEARAPCLGGGAPVTEVPSTSAPAPATEAPQTEPPRTSAPRTNSPPTSAPPTQPPATEAPGTPATPVPSTSTPPSTPPTSQPPRVFLMAGQSNMVGHGKTADLKNYLSLRTDLLETRSDVFAKSIIERARGTGGLGPFYGSDFGPELGFGHVLGDALSEDVYLFKASKGGTQIARADHWSPTGDADNLYAQMVAGFAAFRATLPADHVVSGFVWSQGYNDGFADADANGYEAALIKLIAAVRAEVGVPALPVVVVQGNDNQGALGDVIRRAQAGVATADAHADWVPSDDLYHYYHYDGGSMVAIGERAGRAMLPLLGVSAAGAFPDVYVAVLGAVLQVDAAEGVLANDRGVAAQGAQAVVTAAPAHGTLHLGASGGFVYTPAAAFVGRDTFSYTVVQNGVAGSAAEVEVWVETQDAAAEHLILHYAFESAGVLVSPSAAPLAVYDSTKHVLAYVDPSGVSVGVPGGVSGNCAELSGRQGAWNNGHMKVQMAPMPAFLLLREDDVTVSTWVKIAAKGDVGNMPIFSNAGRPNSPGLTLLTAGAGKSFKTVVYARDGEQVTVAGNTAHPIDDGEWHHVAAVVSRATDTATNYVDGVAVATASIAGVVGLFEEGYYTRFGGVAWLGKYNKFVGHMDEMRVYRAALSPSQVAQLYADRM